MPAAFPEKQAQRSRPLRAAQGNEFCEILSLKVSKQAGNANSCNLHTCSPATPRDRPVNCDFAKPSVCDCKMFPPNCQIIKVEENQSTLMGRRKGS